MRRSLSISLLALSLASAAVGQTPARGAAPQTAEQTLRRLTDEWARVAITRDSALLNRIWAPDFLYVDSDGHTFGKSQGMTDAATSTSVVTAATANDVKIRIYGGTAAVVVGDYREVGRDKAGKAFDHRSRFTNFWVLQQGTWRCVAGHLSDLPPK
jgi:ketosteroid isomerase-like protein